MCIENINFQYKTIFTSSGQNTAEFNDTHNFFYNRALYILVRISVETALFCITSNGKVLSKNINPPPLFNKRSY